MELSIEEVKTLFCKGEPNTVPAEPTAQGDPSLAFIGEYVIARCSAAGVHAGVLVALDGETALLHDSRRLWAWKSQFTLSELSQGVGTDTANCKFSIKIERILLNGVAEVIPCTSVGRVAIEGVRVHNG